MIGHSPLALKRLYTWLIHEASMDKQQLNDYLVKEGINVNNIKLGAWCTMGNRPSWIVWQSLYVALNKLLSEYGMQVEDFTLETTYTPANLRNLRENSGLTVDVFCARFNIEPKKLLLLESDSQANKKGLGFKQFHTLCQSLQTPLIS